MLLGKLTDELENNESIIVETINFDGSSRKNAYNKKIHGNFFSFVDKNRLKNLEILSITAISFKELSESDKNYDKEAILIKVSS